MLTIEEYEFIMKLKAMDSHLYCYMASRGAWKRFVITGMWKR